MALEKGVSGMLEALTYIEKRKAEGPVDISTCLYATSSYWYKNLELQLKVHHKNTTKYFHIDWENPTEDDDEYPLKATAPENSSADIFDLFMSIEEDLSPETKETLMWIFDEVCNKERKQYVLLEAQDNGYQYISKLEDAKEIEANTNGVLPFDYVEKYNELDAYLEERTIYPPEELFTIEEVVERIREINLYKTIIIDIDYNVDATMIIVQAEDNKSFAVSVDILPDAEFDEEEMSVATYYLMALFIQATADKSLYKDLTDIEIRQCVRMMLEFQSNSAAEVAGASSTTTTTSTTTSTPASSFRPQVYSGVPADSKSGDDTDSKDKGKGTKGASGKNSKDSSWPNSDYPRSDNIWDDGYYPYD